MLVSGGTLLSVLYDHNLNEYPANHYYRCPKVIFYAQIHFPLLALVILFIKSFRLHETECEADAVKEMWNCEKRPGYTPTIRHTSATDRSVPRDC